MKILHLCNIAGVPSIIAKFMDRTHNTDSLVIDNALRRKGKDHHIPIYGIDFKGGKIGFTFFSIAKAFQFNIIHVHDFDKIVFPLKVLGFKVIIHYHGSRIRHRWNQRKKFWKFADKILYSVKDVEDKEMPHRAIYIPNPVDTDFFFPRGMHTYYHRQALTFPRGLNDLAFKYAKEHDLDLRIITEKIPHGRMPFLLSAYPFFIDVKRDCFGLSKTALEALACNCKVIIEDGSIFNGLPREHKPENVVSKVFQVYGGLR